MHRRVVQQQPHIVFLHAEGTARRSRNQIVLVLFLVLVLDFPNFDYEHEDDDEDEKFARSATIWTDNGGLRTSGEILA